MQHKFPSPDPEALMRLNVYDGLAINAQKWLDEREYHRQRQNLHYQSVQQPGIVCGLRVSLLEREEAKEHYPYFSEEALARSRPVEIEPGIAIDVEGNPIVLPPEPRRGRIFLIGDPIDAEGEELTVYLYIAYRYIDPTVTSAAMGDRPSEPQPAFLKEEFFIDLKTEPLTGKEVELCRIQLQIGNYTLQRPRDPAYPSTNELDVCHRTYARWRSPKAVGATVLELNGGDRAHHTQVLRRNLSCLLRSAEHLHPELWGNAEVSALSVRDMESSRVGGNALLCLRIQAGDRNLEREEVRSLQTHITKGGTIWLEFVPPVPATPTPEAAPDPESTESTDPSGWRLFGKKAPASSKASSGASAPVPPAEVAEITDLEDDAPPDLEILASIATVARELDPGLTWQRCDPQHPLMTTPFLFGRLPSFQGDFPGGRLRQRPLELWYLGAIILCVGDLSSFWSGDSGGDRQDIRTAQELGINLLHFSWLLATSYWQANPA